MMADCFSLENTDELLERLHNRARSCVTDKALIYYDAIDVIEQLLAENAKLKAELDAAPVVRGEWITDSGENTLHGVNDKCSNCGFRNFSFTLFNYCPNCGAKMDGGKDGAY